ncbi:MAG: hypothetical protein K0U98_02435 [Deltaproteobacteria bacterium]|nr:hypothetical protein [Deltaproteobacteria bacterium]
MNRGDRRGGGLLVFLSVLLIILALPSVSFGQGESGRSSPPAVPVLRFEAPVELSGYLPRLESAEEKVLEGALARTGLESPGGPIRVILAANGSPLAARAPGWVSGYAYGELGVVVLLVERVPTYPTGSLQEVLRHEIAHVLIERAAGGGEVPRWFHEGLAMAADGRWGLSDAGRFAVALVRIRKLTLPQLDAAFGGTAGEVASAYALAGAFVRQLEGRYGTKLAPLIFAGMRDGETFSEAFQRLTGVSEATAQRAFFRSQGSWMRWLPFLTSYDFLWFAMALLALAAIWRRRARNQEIEQMWDDEERWLVERQQRQQERWLEQHRLMPEKNSDGEWIN